jgi:hypothetical protein
MLKSQQSKRSRAKSKAMTLDNYTTLLTAAIAEDIIREIYNKPKSAGGFHRAAGTVDYTIDQLQALHDDQEALRKEIRNVQSKKSIMKSKNPFLMLKSMMVLGREWLPSVSKYLRKIG